MTIIAAFDLATETGCCDGAVGAERPRLWSWYLSDNGPARPARLGLLHLFLEKYFAKEKCDAVVYEAPLPHGVKIDMSEETVAFLRGAVGVLEATCYRFGRPVESLSVQDARASVLGWRTNRAPILIARKAGRYRGKMREETTKERVVREVKTFFHIDPQNDNEADAYVLWRFACNKQNPRLAVASTPLFRENV